jgi:hypothetical protein
VTESFCRCRFFRKERYRRFARLSCTILQPPKPFIYEAFVIMQILPFMKRGAYWRGGFLPVNVPHLTI